jgi:hypothetical protein
MIFVVSACSPKSLFGIGDSNSSSNFIPNYQPVNRSCSNLDLSSPQIQGQELRAVLKCFNAYGALDPIQKLFDRLTDDQLNALVKLGNEKIVGDPTLLYELEQSYYDGKNTGALDSSLKSVALLFDNPDLITSILALLDTGDAPGSADLDRKTLNILQTLAIHLAPQSVDDMTSLVMNLSTH